MSLLKLKEVLKKEGQHEYLSPVKVILNRSVKPSFLLFELLGKKINQPKI